MKKSLKVLTLGMAGFVFSAKLAYADVASVTISAVTISAIIAQNANTVTIAIKEIKSENEELIVDIGIPVVSGMKDMVYQGQWNADIERLAMEDLEKAKSKAHEAIEKTKAAGYPVHPYMLTVRADVKTNGGAGNQDRISFTVTTDLATGGTTLPRIDTYNVLDAAAAKRITLEDLLGPDYKEVVDKEVTAQIAAKPDLYTEGAFQGISETQLFYVQGNEVVAVFPKYSIAAGYVGSPEFRIALPGVAEPIGGVKLSVENTQTTSPELNVNMSIPILEGSKDTKYQEQLNAVIKRQALLDLDNAKKSAAEAAAHAKEAGYEERPYELIIKGELKSDGGAANGDRVSLSIITYLANGGTMGPRLDTFNYLDTLPAAPLSLEGLLGRDYQAVVTKAVYEGIAAEPDKYFADTFTGIEASQSFYVEGEDVVVVFPKYAIAPGSTGMPEFRIPILANGGVTSPASPAIVLAAEQTFKNDVGTTMVPLRLVAESLGYKVTWKEATRSVDLMLGAQFTTVYEGKDAYFRNKMAPVSLSGAATNEEGTMYVPLAFVTDILSAKADVNGQGWITIH